MPKPNQQHASIRKKRRPSNNRRGARNARNKKIVYAYPVITFEDIVSSMQKDQCAKCELYVGRIALLPCGHAKYCGKCVNDMKNKSVKNMYPMRCFCKSCLRIITSWFVLNQIN